ncbi:MAG TPA: hypothetical protein VIA63_02505 [Candidatus Limnocylindria bacterium]|jgi:hypothetical protein
MHLANARLWASVGFLLVALGMPYCSAALGWAVTQDETTLTVRADVAIGVAISWLGTAMAGIAGVTHLVRKRSRGEAVSD